MTSSLSMRTAVLAALVTATLLGGCAPPANEPTARTLYLPHAYANHVLLQVSLDGPSEVRAGQTITYQVGVENTGPYDLGLVRVLCYGHELLELDVEATAWEEVADDDVWEYYVGHLDPGESRFFEIQGRAIGTGEMSVRAGATFVPYVEISTESTQ